MVLLFKELEKLLAARLDIADEAQVTFRGRLQNMQRLGFPAGVNTGRGKRVDYGWSEIFQLALAFDLIDAGLPQEAATNLVNSNLDSVDFGISAFAGALMRADVPAEWVLSMQPPLGHGAYLFCAVNSLRKLKASPETFEPYINFIGEDEIASDDNEMSHELLIGGRIVLDLGRLVLFALNFISTRLEKGSEPTLNSFKEWLVEVKK